MMKKMWLLLVILVSIVSPYHSHAETDEYASIHEAFAEFTTDELLALQDYIEIELEYRGYYSNEKATDVMYTEDGTFFLPETLTRDLICEFLEDNGLKIERVMFQPLVEKDKGGLYGGKERWWVTLENGDKFAVWTANGKI